MSPEGSTSGTSSRHRTRHVLDFSLQDFDYIIGMDSNVFMQLTAMSEIPKEKLYGWEILTRPA